MKEFKDKIAVVTGAASGIGLETARLFAREGMKVVLVDVEAGPLAKVEEEMKAGGATVLAVATDVSNADEVDVLARKTLDAFGAVHVLFNNAGVSGVLTNIWESTIKDWEWILGVNLYGVVNGIRTFVPIMLKQDTQCHIVNTASLAGITAGPALGAYKVSKHGVFSLSETLYHEMIRLRAKINVSVLCPYWTRTGMMESDRNRPDMLLNKPDEEKSSPDQERAEQILRHVIETGKSPVEVAEIVLNAIKEEKFYIFTHDVAMDHIRLRMEDILNDRNPSKPLNV